MFGAYRYLLAILVVLSHLGPGAVTGQYAVFGFYLLSGYLMTLSLNRVYGFTLAGRARFAANRFLRIYIPYWAVMLLSLVLIAALPDTALSLNPALYLARDAPGWLNDLTIFGLGFDTFTSARPIPPSWSLGVELSVYVLMAVGLSRNRWIAVLWFVAAVIYHAFFAADASARYYPVQAALLPFAIGALVYHFRPRLPAWNAVIAVALFIANMWAASTLPFWQTPWWGEFYLSLVLATYLTVALKDMRLPASLAKIDRFLGGLAYPIFLCHWPVAIPFWALLGRPAEGYALLMTSIVPVHIVAYVIHTSIERPVERLRDTVRSRGIAWAGTFRLWRMARTPVDDQPVRI